MIRYDLPESSPVALRVFDIAGRLILVLEDVAGKEAATYKVSWDGRSTQGTRAPSGIYFFRLDTGTLWGS